MTAVQAVGGLLLLLAVLAFLADWRAIFGWWLDAAEDAARWVRGAGARRRSRWVRWARGGGR